MADWRIPEDQKKLYDEIYKGIKLLQIKFPKFWQRAVEVKNNFFRYVFDEAERHVKLLKRGEDYLADELCQKWWHRHCTFCWKTLEADMQEECYCSEDGDYWICAECYNDFKKRFEWKVTENAQDIPAEGFAVARISCGDVTL